MMVAIARTPLSSNERVSHTAELFGAHFPLQLEPYVYTITCQLSSEYKGGYWQFYVLDNGGFYMAPEPDRLFFVACENGYEGNLSADALGITACLYAYSHLSFSDIPGFAETCAQHYHRLRDYMLEHPEARDILGAIDWGGGKGAGKTENLEPWDAEEADRLSAFQFFRISPPPAPSVGHRSGLGQVRPFPSVLKTGRSERVHRSIICLILIDETIPTLSALSATLSSIEFGEANHGRLAPRASI